MPSIHGHVVMELMLEHPEGLTRPDLEHAVARRFGAETRFHSGSREDMSITELIDFLDQRGKFEDSEGKLYTASDRVCSH